MTSSGIGILRKVQLQRFIESLHDSAANKGISPVLEISSKSPNALGAALSAFNLRLEIDDGRVSRSNVRFKAAKYSEMGDHIMICMKDRAGTQKLTNG